MRKPADQRLYTPEFLRVTVIMSLVMTTMTMFFLLPILIKQMGGGAFDIGLVMGVMSLGAVLSRIFWGWWLDRGGRKRTLLLSILINTAAVFLFLTVRSVGPWMVFLRVLQGVALGGNITAVWTIIADITPPARLAESLGIFGIAGMVALALGPWGGELILAGYGFRGLFIVSGLLSALSLLLTLTIRESRPAGFCDSIIPSYRKMLGSGVLPVFLVTVAFAASRGAFASFFAEYSRLQRIGSIGTYSLIYSGTTIAFRLLAGRLADRVGRERVLVPGLIVFGTGIGLIAVIHSWPVFIISAFLAGLGHCFLYPVLNALVIQKVHSCTRGTATGLFISSFDIGIGAGSLVWGLTAQLGGYHLMYLLGGSVVLWGVWEARRLGRRTDDG